MLMLLLQLHISWQKQFIYLEYYVNTKYDMYDFCGFLTMNHSPTSTPTPTTTNVLIKVREDVLNAQQSSNSIEVKNIIRVLFVSQTFNMYDETKGMSQIGTNWWGSEILISTCGGRE